MDISYSQISVPLNPDKENQKTWALHECSSFCWNRRCKSNGHVKINKRDCIWNFCTLYAENQNKQTSVQDNEYETYWTQTMEIEHQKREYQKWFHSKGWRRYKSSFVHCETNQYISKWRSITLFTMKTSSPLTSTWRSQHIAIARETANKKISNQSRSSMQTWREVFESGTTCERE